MVKVPNLHNRKIVIAAYRKWWMYKRWSQSTNWKRELGGPKKLIKTSVEDKAKWKVTIIFWTYGKDKPQGIMAEGTQNSKFFWKWVLLIGSQEKEQENSKRKKEKAIKDNYPFLSSKAISVLFFSCLLFISFPFFFFSFLYFHISCKPNEVVSFSLKSHHQSHTPIQSKHQNITINFPSESVWLC